MQVESNIRISGRSCGYENVKQACLYIKLIPTLKSLCSRTLLLFTRTVPTLHSVLMNTKLVNVNKSWLHQHFFGGSKICENNMRAGYFDYNCVVNEQLNILQNWSRHFLEPALNLCLYTMQWSCSFVRGRRLAWSISYIATVTSHLSWLMCIFLWWLERGL